MGDYLRRLPTLFLAEKASQFYFDYTVFFTRKSQLLFDLCQSLVIAHAGWVAGFIFQVAVMLDLLAAFFHFVKTEGGGRAF